MAFRLRPAFCIIITVIQDAFYKIYLPFITLNNIAIIAIPSKMWMRSPVLYGLAPY